MLTFIIIFKSSMNSKQSKPEFSIQAIKDVVKKFKNSGFNELTHHDLAIALSTIGFTEVCKQFGATWGPKHEKQAQRILQDSDYDLSWYGKTNSLKFTTLIPLCSRGDIEKVKQLISCQNREGLQQMASTVDNFKRTGLHIAVKQGYDILAQYLINEGFSVNARDRELKTPLHYCKNELICQVLLNAKAKIIVKDNKYCTPVHYAASGKDYRCLEMMLKNSNVVNQLDSTGKSALFYSVFNTSEEQVNIMRILFENGAKVNEKDMFGKTPLHYAAELGKPRCIPILLQKGASVDARDKNSRTPLDLAVNEKVRKIILAYCNNKGVIFEKQQEGIRKQYNEIKEENRQQSHANSSNINRNKKSKLKETNSQIYTKDINQVSTWIRQKFFVLMKKLQQSGIKAYWHLKRPYVYTGSWAEDIDSLEDLYEVFLNVNGPEAAMRTFNILCPYQKPLPSVIGKSEEAFQSFFGENWFSTDPIQKIRNLHSTSKIRSELEAKAKQNQDLQLQLLGYKSQIEGLQSKILAFNEEISHYRKIEDDLRKERSKNTQQYTQILKLMNQNEQLKGQINGLIGGEQKTKILSNVVDELRSKNQDLIAEIDKMRVVEAAARRRCGQIFLKTLSMAQNSEFAVPEGENLYDDDSIISLYNLLKNNPPNLQKRFKNADRRGNNKLNIDEFTKMLEELSMLPQDVMSMHRITGFAFGRKTLSLEQFKTILENRHKNRPMWEKKLVRKIKTIILENGMDLDKFFTVMDKDGNGTIEASELRRGLENYNIFMNQNDWSNLFNLLDSDKSGEIDLNQLKVLLEQERTGKLDELHGTEKVEEQQNKGEQQQNKGEEQNKGKQENKGKQNKEDQQNKDQQQNKDKQNKEQQSEQFSQPYEQKDSDQQQGIIKLNGTLKIQLPAIKLPQTLNLEKVYVKFFIFEDIDSDDAIKMVDLTKKKLSIVTEIKFIAYKIHDLNEVVLNVSVWASREMNEENYLGEVFINLREAFEKVDEWAINDKFKLTAEEYEKPVKGVIVLQIKWSPEEE